MAIIKLKRGNTTTLASLSLNAGEPAFVLDTGKLYIGNGTDKVLINPDITNVDSSNKLATARTISLTGDITGSVSFDGSSNVSITTAYKNSGVTAGTYPKVTVDAKGNITSGTTLSASDIPNLDAGKITTGTLGIATIPTGTTSATVSLGNHTHSTYVPTTRTINNKALSANISLTATDIGAYTKAEIDAKNFLYADDIVVI